MLKNPFISIIIPVYNVEAYVAECLDSILRWQFADWEAILIDDGSPDNSGDICDEYAQKDARFKVVHKENEGVSVARNVGLDMALGEWCWFVDSDDLIDAHTPVDKELLAGKDMVMFNSLSFQDGESMPLQNGDGTVETCADLNAFYLKHISWAHQTLWYHRKFWGKNGMHSIRFSKGIRLGEDGEFMRKCELLSLNPIKISHTSYYYRLRQGSATHDPEKEQIIIADAFAVLKNMISHLERNRVTPAEWKTYRLITIAKSIPPSAIKCGLWKGDTILSYKRMVNRYQKLGFNLLQDRTIRLATLYPWIYGFVARIKYKKHSY